MTPALSCERVAFAYDGRPVLRDVTCVVAPGEAVAVIGRNGAGKTTLIRLIAGLERAATGTVRVAGWDAARHRPDELARRVAVVFQHADQQLFARTVWDDVAFGPRALGVPHNEAVARVEAALADLRLEDVAHDHPYDLPAPMRKLAALAGALALAPALLVLDEPTAGLDRTLRARVGRVVRDRRAAGCAVVVVTHDVAFAAETLDRALVLDGGSVVFDGAIAELCRDPDRLRVLGLREPPVAALSRTLALPGRPVRIDDAAPIVAACCASDGRPYIDESHGQT
jgi:energy-coupling factor transporter ATP-binding protein EcfA2